MWGLKIEWTHVASGPGLCLIWDYWWEKKRLFKKKSIETESRWAAAQAGDGDKGNGISLMGIGFPSGVMEMFESLIKVVVVQYYECY